MSEVAATWKVEPHDSRVWWQQRRVDGEVGRTAGVRLHVNTPLLLIQAKGFQSALLAEVFHLVDHLVAAVVTSPRLSLRVLVGERRSQALEHCPGGEVLRCNELD